ncbi:MAG: T9SS C-terminal target domain-containing protein [Bacteroidetes bacterium]|nr:MAG: T9SS C-terminal target domain-containing protein [Bacteroidota bacterium]
MCYNYIKCLILLSVIIPFTGIAQYLNVMIGNQFYPEEPSIMINPYNTDQVVAAANINLYYYSGDGGMTWAQGELSSSYGVWGDPCIIVDTAGHFYFFHLSNPPGGNWVDRIVCQKTTDGGQTWNNGSYMGLNGSKVQDKEWTVVDPANNYLYTTWTQFDAYGSANPMDSSIIRFSRSTDGGESWSEAVRINRVAGDCIDSDNTVEGAVPALGPNGEIYTSWAGPLGLVFTKSLDQGITWPAENVFVADFPGGWDYAIPGIYRANGLPVTCCDLSGGPYHGRIYINWSDQRNGLNDTDVWLTKSDDGGETWSSIIRVNDDPPGKQQFFTWMTIDQTTGYLYFVFYDRRNYTNNLTDVYLAVSEDGGGTFENIKISESPFNPIASVFFGDYTNISVHSEIIRPIWARLDEGNLSVWTALIDSLHVGITPGKEIAGPLSLEQNYPNPFQEYTYFPYKIHTPASVTLSVFDMFGRQVAVVVQDRLHQPGKYVEQFDASQYNLSPGFYYVSLTCGEQTQKRKMIIE